MKVTPFGKKHEATEKKLQFAAGSSDHLTMLNAYNVSITDKYMQELLLAKTWHSTGSLVQELWYTCTNLTVFMWFESCGRVMLCTYRTQDQEDMPLFLVWYR